ncbi:hypothetical protein EDB80DRAFT_866686 [Ilyonectria destructans]|nr:hypothetical protein EDB80DRAFT_866686 [Ilyonectria destructans]
MAQSLTPALEYPIQSLSDDGFCNGDSWDSDETTGEYTLDQDHPFQALFPDLLQLASDKFLTWAASASDAAPPEDRLPPRKRIKRADSPPSLVCPEEEKETGDSELVEVSRDDGFFHLACPFYVKNLDKHRDCLQSHGLNSIGDLTSHLLKSHRRGLFSYASALLPWTTVKSNATSTMANICYRDQYSPSPKAGQRDPLRQKKAGVSKEREKGSRKRRRGSSGNNNNDNPGDSDDEGSGDERGQSNDDAAEDKTRFWACLFYASDPHNHFRCLGKYSIKRFSDVVQHLERCHALHESFYCPKCWRQQISRAGRDYHIRDCSSPNLPPRPGRLYDDELAEVKERLKSLRGYTNEDKWFAMWDMIFPGRPRPDTPYVEQGMAEPAGVLRRNNEPDLHAEMPQLLGELGAQPSPQDIATFVAAVVSIAFQVPSREPQHVGLSLIGDQASLTSPSRGLQSGHAPPNIPAVPSNPSHSQPLAGDQFHYDNQTLYEGSTTMIPATDEWPMHAGPLIPDLSPANPFSTNPTGDFGNSFSLLGSEHLPWP